uniref:Uncharacterized protein n=1 Tax=Steinernema glaseri TaxID=37863 RepID=A0A1I8A8Y4_9BILA
MSNVFSLKLQFLLPNTQFFTWIFTSHQFAMHSSLIAFLLIAFVASTASAQFLGGWGGMYGGYGMGGYGLGYGGMGGYGGMMGGGYGGYGMGMCCGGGYGYGGYGGMYGKRSVKYRSMKKN